MPASLSESDGDRCELLDAKQADVDSPIPQAVKVALVSLDSSDEIKERKLLLTPDKPVIVGRASKSEARRAAAAPDNAFIASAVVSRKHATLSVKPSADEAYIKDESSMHGTFVNGCELHKHAEKGLGHGDIVTFGSSVVRGNETHKAAEFRFEYDQPNIVLSKVIEREETVDTKRAKYVVPESNTSSEAEEDSYASEDEEISWRQELTQTAPEKDMLVQDSLADEHSYIPRSSVYSAVKATSSRSKKPLVPAKKQDTSAAAAVRPDSLETGMAKDRNGALLKYNSDYDTSSRQGDDFLTEYEDGIPSLNEILEDDSMGKTCQQALDYLRALYPITDPKESDIDSTRTESPVKEEPEKPHGKSTLSGDTSTRSRLPGHLRIPDPTLEFASSNMATGTDGGPSINHRDEVLNGPPRLLRPAAGHAQTDGLYEAVSPDMRVENGAPASTSLLQSPVSMLDHSRDAPPSLAPPPYDGGLHAWVSTAPRAVPGKGPLWSQWRTSAQLEGLAAGANPVSQITTPRRIANHINDSTPAISVETQTAAPAWVPNLLARKRKADAMSEDSQDDITLAASTTFKRTEPAKLGASSASKVESTDLATESDNAGEAGNRTTVLITGKSGDKSRKRIKLQLAASALAGAAVGSIGVFATLLSLPDSLFE